MIIAKASLPALLDELASTQRVLVPAVIDGVSKFAPYGKDVEARFDLPNTKLPPKDALFPATERMYRWARNAQGEVTFESDLETTEPFVLFGLRPCDMMSIDRMDDVFLTKGFVDEFYQAKRDAVLTVAIACTQAQPTCFCQSMGGSPTEAPTADIMMREAGDFYEATAQTQKGEDALAAWQAFAAEGEAGAPAEVSCTLNVSMDGVMDKLSGMFDHPMWEEISNTCLTCGTCTFVCPTCHCFDISQDRRIEEGNRFRCWDSCMFTDYTLMAGDHNPRALKSARVRQRFMHKLCYFEQRYGSSLCVGCGRCLVECPVGVDITRIIEKVGESDA